MAATLPGWGDALVLPYPNRIGHLRSAEGPSQGMCEAALGTVGQSSVRGWVRQGVAKSNAEGRPAAHLPSGKSSGLLPGRAADGEKGWASSVG